MSFHNICMQAMHDFHFVNHQTSTSLHLRQLIIVILVTKSAFPRPSLLLFYFIRLIEGPMSHSRKHPYHPHRGNRKLTPLLPSDVLIHLLLSETTFSPFPLRTAEISSVGGVWIFSGTTQYPFV